MPPDLNIGTVADGRYKLIEVIGTGSTSTVYKAEHQPTRRIVALKVLKPEGMTDGSSLRRFQLEAQAGSRVGHRNVCALHDFGIESSGQPYIAMDFCEGKTLAELIEEMGTIKTPLAVSIFSEVCEALDYIHRAGLVHRGINPTDIIVNINTDDDITSIKVIDFGYAKILSADTDAKTKGLTPTEEILGRAFYMSPEQCQGENVDSRSDVYSLGCVMYEALTGNLPFKGDSFMSTITKQVSDTAPSFNASNPNLAIPAQIEAIVLRAIEKDPSHRYQSMLEMKDALQQKSTQTQKRKWWPW